MILKVVNLSAGNPFKNKSKLAISHLEMSLGSTEARPNCHKCVGPGRLQVLYHHTSQVQVHGAHQGHKGVVLVS